MGDSASTAGAGRKVLVVDPDPTSAASACAVLSAAGLVAEAVPGAALALKKLSAFEPATVLLELTMSQHDGAWFLRRLRDDFMGTRPRVVVLARPDAVTANLGTFGIDALVLKPAGPAALVAAATGATVPRPPEAELLRELVTLPGFEADAQRSLAACARRLAHAFRVTDCVVAGVVGDRQYLCAANGPVEDQAGDAIRRRCRLALDAAAPLLAPTDGGQVDSYLAVPIHAPVSNGSSPILGSSPNRVGRA